MLRVSPSRGGRAGRVQVVDALSAWLNTRGADILDRMYDMLPFTVAAAMAAVALVWWLTGMVRR